MIRKITYLLLIVVLLSVTTIYFCNRKINKQSQGKLFTDTQEMPYNKVGLLLGTGKYLKHGSINPYYAYRIDAAKTLLQTGKIKYLIISGDNSTAHYDEPTDMRADLIAAGIDSTVIFLDYAGFRTFDSIIRAREIFGQTNITVISQQFHNERALYIANRENINAIGFNARDISGSMGFRVQVREKLARVKVFADYLFSVKPKFLGPNVVIPD